jgi:hypothetical protein
VDFEQCRADELSERCRADELHTWMAHTDATTRDAWPQGPATGLAKPATLDAWLQVPLEGRPPCPSPGRAPESKGHGSADWRPIGERSPILSNAAEECPGTRVSVEAAGRYRIGADRWRFPLAVDWKKKSRCCSRRFHLDLLPSLSIRLKIAYDTDHTARLEVHAKGVHHRTVLVQVQEFPLPPTALSWHEPPPGGKYEAQADDAEMQECVYSQWFDVQDAHKLDVVSLWIVCFSDGAALFRPEERATSSSDSLTVLLWERAKRGECCDAFLRSRDGTPLTVHRSVLSQSSVYLALFRRWTADTPGEPHRAGASPLRGSLCELEWPTSPLATLLILRAMYLGPARAWVSRAGRSGHASWSTPALYYVWCEVFCFAAMYGLEQLVTGAEDILVSHLSPTTFPILTRLSGLHTCSAFDGALHRFVEAHPFAVTTFLQNVRPPALCDILAPLAQLLSAHSPQHGKEARFGSAKPPSTPTPPAEADAGGNKRKRGGDAQDEPPEADPAADSKANPTQAQKRQKAAPVHSCTAAAGASTEGALHPGPEGALHPNGAGLGGLEPGDGDEPDWDDRIERALFAGDADAAATAAALGADARKEVASHPSFPASWSSSADGEKITLVSGSPALLCSSVGGSADVPHGGLNAAPLPPRAPEASSSQPSGEHADLARS